MNLQQISGRIGQRFEEMDRARDQSLINARKVIKNCSLAIRAVHRGESAEVDQFLAEARNLLSVACDQLRAYPDVYYSGFLQDAEKEYAEAQITYRIVTGKSLPGPEDLGVDFAPYLNGMAEAVGELRRQVLDQLRRGDLERAENLLSVMDDIYYVLISMDFPDAITRGLRRSTDIARGCLEKTRGDLTHHSAGHNLERELSSIRNRLSVEADQLLQAALR
jgi:translin